MGTLLLTYSWRWWWYWDTFIARITQTGVLFCWFIETVVTTGGNNGKRKKSGQYTRQSALHSRYCIYSTECRAVRYILGPAHIIPEKFWKHTFLLQFFRLANKGYWISNLVSPVNLCFWKPCLIISKIWFWSVSYCFFLFGEQESLAHTGTGHPI